MPQKFARDYKGIKYGCHGPMVAYRRLLHSWVMALALVTFTIFSHGDEIPSAQTSLISLVESLREKGYRILYSSDLVKPELNIAADEHSMSLLRKVLARFSLQLKRKGRVWIITRADEQLAMSSGYLFTLEGNPVSNGRIRALNSGVTTYSGGDGYFELTRMSRDDMLEVSAAGFQSQRLPPRAFEKSPVILLPNDWLETIIVTGSRFHIPRQQDLFASFLTIEQMNLTPALGGDALRVVTKLPGVSSVGVTAKPRIRGGLQDELLILLDGVELLEPFHLSDFYSLFSTIDDRMVDSIDFYTGGFPTRYGNRMSGVMDVTSSLPVTEPGTELGLSLFSTFINTKGKTSTPLQMDWLLSARRGNLSEIARISNSRWGEPRYHDAFARATVSISEATKLGFGALFVNDDVLLTDDEESAGSEIDTYHFWARLNHRLREGFYSSLLVSYLNNRRLQFQRIVEAEEDLEGEEPDIPGFLDYSQKTERLALRNDYSLKFDRHQLEFGFQLEHGQSDYDYIAHIDRGIIAEILGLPSTIARTQQINSEGWSGGLYASLEYLLTPTLSLRPGIRWDFQDYYFDGSDQQFSPRFGISYQPNNSLSLSASLGRFYQPEGQFELPVRDDVRNFTAPQRSDQLILSLEWERDKLHLKGEAYYKAYAELKPRYENLFHTFVLLPQMLPDRVAIAPEQAIVKGFELSATYSIDSNLTGQLRYSAMQAKDQINGQWINRRWSQDHTIHAGLTWQRGTFSVSGELAWHSGWRTTTLPNQVPADSQLPLELVLNNNRLRDYFSVDVSVNKTWQVGETRIMLHADVTNLLNRKNVAGVEYDVLEMEDVTLFDEGNTKLLPIVPSIGVIVSF